MTPDVYRSPCGAIELRCGRYQDVLQDVEPDAVICDPPYGARTHNGQRHGRKDPRYSPDRCLTGTGLPYAAWTPEDVDRFVDRWQEVPGWLCVFTSHDLAGGYEDAARARGRTTFAPLACVQRGMNVRLAGDGPSNWTTWLCVSRPRFLRAWGTLPGAYVGGQDQDRKRSAHKFVGGKSLWLMRAIIRDYTRPGDLVCDPCSGGATTLLE